MSGVLQAQAVSAGAILVLAYTPVVLHADDVGWAAEPVVAALTTAPPPPDAPPWGACGRSTDPDKLVRLFVKNQHTDYALRCGGPKYSSNPLWGYRHILKNHKADFERLAFGTYQNWRDIADLAMRHNTLDPDVTKSGNRKICYSRVIYLLNRRTGQLVRTTIIRMIVSSSTNNIITAYPGEHCA